MNKYIDAEKLKTKVNEVRQDWLGDSTGLEVGESAAELGAAESILDAIDEIIESLQQEQPEVDLKKEIEEHAIFMPHGEFASDNEIQEDMEWAKKEFRHFYEMGINARK